MPLDGRENAVQHVVFALVGAHPLQRQHIQRFFHHANHAFVPCAAFADFAAFPPGLHDVEALRAKGGVLFEGNQRLS